MSEVTKKLVTHYERCLAEHGSGARGMDWENEERLKIRFGALVRALGNSLENCSLLDVGCGSGLLLDYLIAEGLPFAEGGQGTGIVYTGVDASERMIDAARANHPGADFQTCDAARLAEQLGTGKYDLVVSNGLFTLKGQTSSEEMDRFFEVVLEQMYRCSRRGIAFNVMTKHVDFEAPHLYYRWPGDVLNHCVRHLSRRVSLHHDYPLYEFFTCVRHPDAG